MFEIIIVVALILLNALFALTETTIVSSQRFRLESNYHIVNTAVLTIIRNGKSFEVATTLTEKPVR